MSKSVAAPRASESMSSSKDQPAASKPAPKAIAPFKPHRKLAIGLLVVFLVWMVILYVMYFTTVYGHSAR